jgi:hypothetical protein
VKLGEGLDKVLSTPVIKLENSYDDRVVDTETVTIAGVAEDPDFVRDRVIVDVWEDWLEPVAEGTTESEPIDRTEHELSYYDRRVAALQALLVQKGVMNLDESRRMVAEFDFRKKGTPHPMVSPP